jgi:hypothetical protein
MPTLPDVRPVLRSVGPTVLRFPLPLLAAATGMVLLLVALPDGPGLDMVPPVALGIPLFLALRLAGERRLLPRWTEGILAVAVALGLLALHVAWDGWSEPIRAIRYLQLFVAAHLLVAVVPFLRDPRGFRPFNRHLLLNLLEGGLQAAVLMVGISAALLAVDVLFAVSVPGVVYARLAVILGLGFLPLRVLAGVDLDPTEEDPRVLRVLGHTVLVPLGALYLVILTLYLGQVLVTRSWPSGWIGWLVSWMAVVGILSILLVRPSEPGGARPGGRPAGSAGRASRVSWATWEWIWERTFWLLMLPASGMLLVAVGKRVQQYGVTEPRYMALALGGWLAVLAFAFGILRLRDLRLLPASLALVLLASFGGPWGMAAMSRESQLGRLSALLASHDMLVEGRAVPTPTHLPEADRQQVRAILTYLFETHPSQDLAGLLAEVRDAEVPVPPQGGTRVGDTAWPGPGVPERVEAVMTALGVAPPLGGAARGRMLFQRADAGDAGLPLAGFHRLHFFPLGLGSPSGTPTSSPRSGSDMDTPGTDPPERPSARQLVLLGDARGPRVRLVLRETPGGQDGAAAGRAGDLEIARFDLSRLAVWMSGTEEPTAPGSPLPPGPGRLDPVLLPTDALAFDALPEGPEAAAALGGARRLRLVVDALSLEWQDGVLRVVHLGSAVLLVGDAEG